MTYGSKYITKFRVAHTWIKTIYILFLIVYFYDLQLVAGPNGWMSQGGVMRGPGNPRTSHLLEFRVLAAKQQLSSQTTPLTSWSCFCPTTSFSTLWTRPTFMQTSASRLWQRWTSHIQGWMLGEPWHWWSWRTFLGWCSSPALCGSPPWRATGHRRKQRPRHISIRPCHATDTSWYGGFCILLTVAKLMEMTRSTKSARLRPVAQQVQRDVSTCREHQHRRRDAPVAWALEVPCVLPTQAYEIRYQELHPLWVDNRLLLHHEALLWCLLYAAEHSGIPDWRLGRVWLSVVDGQLL